MSHTDINGRPTRRPPYPKSEDGTRASEYGAGRTKPGPVGGARAGNPTNRGQGAGGYTDGKPVSSHLPKPPRRG